MTLSSLQDRLAEATERDLGLEAELLRAMFGGVVPNDLCRLSFAPMSSPDAVIALVERKLATWRIGLFIGPDRTMAQIYTTTQIFTRGGGGQQHFAPTPALALLKAHVAPHIAQEKRS
jgi:hypothetical protein